MRKILCEKCGREVRDNQNDFVWVLRWADAEWEDLDALLEGHEPIDLCEGCKDKVIEFAKSAKL